ncbi:conserved hypothetical protein [Streptomyces pristinaespiralis ATCC 25486]|uniref:Uncharacterized protein n=1 Tax=Streptomyces pristinaespiralis (strain ATCC 25486 / DSM 40338 / CBS 914.69 / JCM 4507 / KCC S-0507 / NBRC 13074 / NRRL 2958 / 5647) TaxID=457429 RepID=B5H5T2_STRE2|nr:conserved hypothetical protein [Streptomyces pristinaespiralis ATCC 25486]
MCLSHPPAWSLRAHAIRVPTRASPASPVALAGSCALLCGAARRCTTIHYLRVVTYRVVCAQNLPTFSAT